MHPSSPAVLAHYDGIDIISQCSEVMWPNGTAVGLHFLRLNGNDGVYLRAIQHAGHWYVFDLRQTCPLIGGELWAMPRRLAVGHIFQALRHQFADADQFKHAVESDHMHKLPAPTQAAA